jgi:hypothetical protein
MDTANSERTVFSLGDPNVTARCPKTLRLYEVGSGALSHAEQTANFVREAARDGDIPKPGECDPKGRQYETGVGCLTRTAQRAIWDRNASPEQAKVDDARASAVETAAEVKKLATDEEAALAAMVILNDNAAATKH